MKWEPIGVIHSPFFDVKGMPIQPTGAADVAGTVEVLPQFHEGLADLDGFSHVVLLYHFHRSDGFALKVVPFLDISVRGVFATRAPRRPNPLGLSIVRLEAVRDGVLHVRGMDVLDGTPLLDIKPYVPAFDHPESVRVGWMEQGDRKVPEVRSDNRFA